MAAKKKICIVFFADSHLGFDYPIRPRIKRRRRGEEFFENHKRVLDYAAKNNADLVIHGGDLFFRSKIPQQIVDLACRTLLDFAATGIDMVLVPGNHERSRFPDTLFLCHPKIHIFRKPQTFVFDFGGTSVAVAGFPFIRNDIRGRFRELLSETGWQDHAAQINVLCLHQAIDGAQVGPSNYTFRNHEDVICIDDLPGELTAVLSGHIHRMQVLKGNNELPVVYPGSIERTSFAEKTEDKGFFHIELEIGANKKSRVEELRFIPLPARPMVDLEVDLGADADSLKACISREVARLDPHAIVRLKPKGKAPEKDAAQEKVWSHAFFKELFPETMNYQISGSFFRNQDRKRQR